MGVSKPKEFSHEKCNQWNNSIYNYFTSMENSRGVPLCYVIRKDTSSPKDSENRDVQIIYQASLVGNMFTRDLREVIDILKELTLGFSFQINLIGIHHIICLKFLQWRRSIGQVQIFIDTSILLRAESHAHLQRSSVEMTQESMSLIEQWQMFPLDLLST